MPKLTIAVVVLAAFALAGCTGGAEPDAVETLIVSGTSTVSGETPGTQDDDNETAVIVPEETSHCFEYLGAPYGEAYISGTYGTVADTGEHTWEVPDGFPDTGATVQANGTTETNADGLVIAYTAAAGDTLFGIAERFCASPTYITIINEVRRGRTDDVYVGDTINLDPYAVYTVGTINGQVHNYEPEVVHATH